MGLNRTKYENAIKTIKFYYKQGLNFIKLLLNMQKNEKLIIEKTKRRRKLKMN